MITSNKSTSVIRNAVSEGLNVGQLLDLLKPLISDGYTLDVNEAQGLTGKAHSDHAKALHYHFSCYHDVSTPLADIVDPSSVYTVSIIDHEGDRFYRFGEDCATGLTCSFDSMIGDLAWFDSEWILTENSDGVFVASN